MASTLIFSDSSISIWLRSYRCAKAAILGCGHFQAFRPGFSIWHICHVVCHGHFTLKQLRFSVLNEMHTNSYTGPRLITWSVLKQSISYTGGSKRCNLCLEEKLCILKNKNKQNLLNKKSEIVSTCNHRKKHLINNLRNGRNACIV